MPDLCAHAEQHSAVHLREQWPIHSSLNTHLQGKFSMAFPMYGIRPLNKVVTIRGDKADHTTWTSKVQGVGNAWSH